MTIKLLAAITVGDLAESVKEGFFMFWETLWPLVLGFGLSGVVQAFIDRKSTRLNSSHLH